MGQSPEVQSTAGIERMPVGIAGLDVITGGGLPRNRTTLLLGASGTGKTVLALQILVNGARAWNEPGIFVAFEEKSRQLMANAASFGWDLPALVPAGLFFLDAHISPDTVRSGGFDLVGMLEVIRAKAREMGARRIVFDSLDVLLRLLQDPAAEQDEVYRLHDWLAEGDMTGILTSGVNQPNILYSHRLDFLQFMADCVVLLEHRVDNRVSQRALRVIKYRGSSFAENEVPIMITESGVEVADFATPVAAYPVSLERVSSGVERLDAMLSGGYFRGASVLVTGAPGTAKSTLAGAFAEAACRRGERTLFIGYDESGQEIVRNLTSVNVHLQPHIDSGCLRLEWVRSDSRSPEEHLLLLKRLIKVHQPRCAVIDPLSALTRAGGPSSVVEAAQRLLYLTKAEGITLLCTSLLEGGHPELEASDLRVSTVADTWIHLTYMIAAGERNRALTVVKSRGTAHSNQVRELILSQDGITLADVYAEGGAVLMGSLRLEKERTEQTERLRLAAETDRKYREFDLIKAELQARMVALQRELELRQGEVDAMAAAARASSAQQVKDRRERLRLRHADRAERNQSPPAPATGQTPGEL